MVELVIAIGIVAVLLAIVLPGLGYTMRTSREFKSLSNLRSHAGVMSLYSSDNEGYLPVFLPPGIDHTLSSGGVSISGLGYFSMSFSWNIFLADEYYRGSPLSASFRSPLEREGDSFPYFTTYLYPCSLVAKPAFWNTRTRRLGTSQFGGNRAADVVYPSEKVLLMDSSRDRGNEARFDASNRATLCALVDGSAIRIKSGSRRAGYPTADGFMHFQDGAFHTTDTPPLLHTVDGVRGRDRSN